jgi:cytoskeleton protein RodZ
MNENQGQAAAEGVGDSAGARLRRAREQSGLHIAALAVTLKVPVKRLEALEADRYDLLPGPVFTRALAASVCRSLKLDAAAVLALLPRAGHHDLVVDGSLNQPFRAYSRPSVSSAWPAVSRPALIAAALILLAAVLVYLMPETGFFTRLPAPAASAPAGEVTEAVAPVNRAEPSPPAAAVPMAVPAASASVAAPASTAPLAAQTVAINGEPILVFSVQRSSWVEVVDATGNAVLRRTLNAGEQVSVAGKPVMRVVVGNAGAVQVKVRGQELDVKALAQDNVARFEVK